MYILRSIMIFLFCFRNGCLADKKHFAKWIKTDNKELYIFETLLGKGLDQCIESCKAKKMCEYINFNVNEDACYLIGKSSISESPDDSHNDKIEKKKGYVFGKKEDWKLEKYEVCTRCEAFGECKRRDEDSDGYTMCQKSGCGPPNSTQYLNTTMYGNMFAVGDKIQYQCDGGYTDVYNDTGTVTCQDSGNWSSSSIKCVPDDVAKNVTCSWNTSCYLLVDTKQRTWQDGQSNCEQYGGHLADIQTEDEHVFIKENIFNKILSEGKQCSAWLGAHYKDEVDTFIWSDGTRVNDSYTAWDAEQPDNPTNEHCMYIRVEMQNTTWKNNICSKPWWYLCEI